MAWRCRYREPRGTPSENLGKPPARSLGVNIKDLWYCCDRCFMIVECDDVTLLQIWTARWRDLVEIEFVPVVSGKDTAAALAPLLDEGTAGAEA